MKQKISEGVRNLCKDRVNTLKFVQRLELAGFTREQATAFAEAQSDVFEEVIETSLATKADIQRLENQSHSDFQRLENRIEQMELRLTIKLGAFMAVGIGAVATMMCFY